MSDHLDDSQRRDAPIREAREDDAPAIRDIMIATYGNSYPYVQFYDVAFLRKTILTDDTLMLVAEDPATGRAVATASVLGEVGAYSDLVGEFGRLAVQPEWRQCGIGGRLMAARLERVRDRIHVGIVDTRVNQTHSQRIALKHGFVPVGFCPLKDAFRTRESTALFAQWFGEALALRRNNPRIIPEAYPLASAVMASAACALDAVVDDVAAPYPREREFEIQELTTTGYSSLLRIERGRTRHREIFGPMRLHYGFFKLRALHAEYLVARRKSQVAGAVGYIRDDYEKMVRIFELITPDEHAVQFLLGEVDRRCRESWGTKYAEIDVRADAPRMQRTLLELGYVPAAYIPAMVFHEVERHDVLRMVRVLAPLDLGVIDLRPDVQTLAELVVGPLREQQIIPEIGPLARRSGLLTGLTTEQTRRIAGICSMRTFAPGERIFGEGDSGRDLHLIVDGNVDIERSGIDRCVGRVGVGEALGEMALLDQAPHTATATASEDGDVRAAVAAHGELDALIRRRPDIGVVLYRNLARGLGNKLLRTDEAHSR